MKLLKTITLLLAIVFAANIVSGQTAPPSIIWQKPLGGSKGEEARFMQLTPDGGCIFTGYARSIDGDLTTNKGDDDLWVVKLDAHGAIEWQQTFGGTAQEWGRHIQLTSDGGYIVAGHTTTLNDNGDVQGNNGGFDYWIVKLSSSGELEWQKPLGGSALDLAYRVQQTADGSYIAFGGIKSTDGDVTGKNNSDADYWMVKLDSAGNKLWDKNIGGKDHEEGSSLELTNDGGFILSGYSDSNNGDVSGNHGDFDALIVKADGDGNIQWSRCYGGTKEDCARDARQTTDGGFIFAGYTQSDDGDVSGKHAGQDAWVVKLDAGGDIQWQKALGGSSLEYAYYIEETRDNSGYLVAGHSGSEDGDVTGNHGMYDCWVLKLDMDGNLLWQKSLGGSEQDYGRTITQTYTGDYLVAGYTGSIDGDVSGKHNGPGSKDAWIIKLQGDCVQQAFFYDGDGDGFGNPAVSVQSCTAPPRYVSNHTDCNDGNYTIHPNTQELQNGIDDDCDSIVDESIRLAVINNNASTDTGSIYQTIKEYTNSTGLAADTPGSNDSTANDFPEGKWNNDSIKNQQQSIATGSSVQLVDSAMPLRSANENLKQSVVVYPNPLISSAIISFSLDEVTPVVIMLLDANGRTVSVIAKEDLAAGNHKITFDRGSLAAGIYFLQLKTGEGVVMKKLVVE